VVGALATSAASAECAGAVVERAPTLSAGSGAKERTLGAGQGVARARVLGSEMC
jgi:hypothetical protein